MVLACIVMKKKLKSIADELREDLARCPDVRAQELIDLDENLATHLQSFTKIVTSGQLAQWRELLREVDQLRDYAQVLKMRLLYGDAELVSKLEVMHSSIEEEEEMLAAIEVERDAHTPKGVTDVLKALLMWKDSPEDKISLGDDKKVF